MITRNETTLRGYIQIHQDKACRLSGVIEAIAALRAAEIAEGGIDALIGVAQDLADDIFRGLDSMSLPKEEPVSGCRAGC